MQDPFQTFLGAEPTDASPLPPRAMSPGADGDPAGYGTASSPQDAQPVVAQQPLAVPAGSEAAATEAPAAPSNMKKYLIIGAVALGAYILLRKKR